MLRPYSPRLEKHPYYKADQIIPYLKEVQRNAVSLDTLKIVILFSGDSGFYSGCRSLYHALTETIKVGELKGELQIMPGISSVSYLASCIGESYQDAEIISIHGRSVTNLARRIAENPKTFLLMTGARDLSHLGEDLIKKGLEVCEITAGIQLSYPEEKIVRLTPEECKRAQYDGLITCMIKNPAAVKRLVSQGTPDEEFFRDKVPMTKEEVREISICKLHLRKNSVVYDIGSGTGSIAIEMAGLSDEIQVFAIERKKDAAVLIRRNQEKFGLENITVVESEAPEGLEQLPVPSHAFIGGSGKHMKEILNVLYQKNPTMRIVMNAVTLETICEMKEILSTCPVANEEIVQVQISRSKKVGTYHMMQAENPVWICSFDFTVQE